MAEWSEIQSGHESTGLFDLPTPTAPPTSLDSVSPKTLPVPGDKTPSKKMVRTAEPVASKPTSAYTSAIERPNDMVKKEEDSCLTCIKNSRRCKGTQLHMVKGHKRCQNCAVPGKGSAGRVCYWSNPDRGVVTFEDAVKIMGKELGGRVLTKNTRQGRLQRQEKAEGGMSESGVVEDDDGTEAQQTENVNESRLDEGVAITSDNKHVYPGPASTLVSSDNIIREVQDVVVGDLGVTEDTPYEMVEELAIRKLLGDALGS